MGRIGRYPYKLGEQENIDDRCRLFRVNIDSGGYDEGGAYWGTGQPLYCLMSDNLLRFARCPNREFAKQLFLSFHPKIRFYK